MFVFLYAACVSTTIPSVNGAATIKVASNGNVALIVHLDNFNLTVADPTQTLTSATVTLTLGSGSTPSGWSSSSKTATATVNLPSGGTIGDSVSSLLF